MSEQKHTPRRWWAEGDGQEYEILGPRDKARHNQHDETWEMCRIENDGFPEHAEADEYNSRLIPASVNAIRLAAARLGTDPLTLAERLEDGGIADVVEALSEMVRTTDDPDNGDLGGQYRLALKEAKRRLKELDCE